MFRLNTKPSILTFENEPRPAHEQMKKRKPNAVSIPIFIRREPAPVRGFKASVLFSKFGASQISAR